MLYYDSTLIIRLIKIIIVFFVFNFSVNEYPESERQTRKISVIIDSESRKYSGTTFGIIHCNESENKCFKVNVQPVRQISADSANDASRVASSSLSSTNESDKAR